MDSVDRETPKPQFDFGVFEDNVRAQEEGREIEILDPTGRGTGVFWTMYGMESPKYRDGIADVDRNITEERRVREETPEDRIADQARLYSWCVKSWRTKGDPYIVFRGERLECSQLNAMRILALSAQLRGQAHMAVTSAANFTKG